MCKKHTKIFGITKKHCIFAFEIKKTHITP